MEPADWLVQLYYAKDFSVNSTNLSFPEHALKGSRARRRKYCFFESNNAD